MDLHAIINHDQHAPPRRPSQASPPAPPPAALPTAPPPPAQPPSLAPPPPLKRRKLREKPIWAHKWSQDWRSQPWAASVPARAPTAPPRQSPVMQRPPSAHQPNGMGRNTQSPANTPGAVNVPKDWEASIADIQPLDEFTKVMGDFLYEHVILASDLGPDAAFEVEAKLGHLIDQNTNERLTFPVHTDTILDKTSPSMRVAFKSTMTEVQHREFNEWLNQNLMKSLPPRVGPGVAAAPPRIPISYKHTRQTDTFYELTPEASSMLPPAILAKINPRANKTRLRVTTDQKTGQEIAKIVKVRIADLDVYTARKPFDWRLSVNIEVNYKGPTQGLTRVMERGQLSAPRSKDRMTYNHLVYQVDLTQVTGPDQSKEHELEVEISKMDELRKEGLALQSGRPNRYVQIVRGFVDNVRVLQTALVRP